MGFLYAGFGTVLILLSLLEPHKWVDKWWIALGGLDYLVALYHWHKWVHEP